MTGTANRTAWDERTAAAALLMPSWRGRSVKAPARRGANCQNSGGAKDWRERRSAGEGSAQASQSVSCENFEPRCAQPLGSNRRVYINFQAKRALLFSSNAFAIYLKSLVSCLGTPRELVPSQRGARIVRARRLRRSTSIGYPASPTRTALSLAGTPSAADPGQHLVQLLAASALHLSISGRARQQCGCRRRAQSSGGQAPRWMCASIPAP